MKEIDPAIWVASLDLDKNEPAGFPLNISSETDLSVPLIALFKGEGRARYSPSVFKDTVNAEELLKFVSQEL